MGLSLELDNGFAYQIGGGVDIFIAENIALFGKVSYLWTEIDATARALGLSLTAEVELDSLNAGGGIKVIF